MGEIKWRIESSMTKRREPIEARAKQRHVTLRSSLANMTFAPLNFEVSVCRVLLTTICGALPVARCSIKTRETHRKRITKFNPHCDADRRRAQHAIENHSTGPSSVDVDTFPQRLPPTCSRILFVSAFARVGIIRPVTNRPAMTATTERLSGACRR